MGLLMFEIALAGAALLVIAWPLLREETAEAQGAILTDSDFSELLTRRDAAYMALKDLDFDYRTGKIDEGDYQALKAELETEALSLLERIERGEPSPKPAARAAGRFCPACGQPAQAAHRFCSSCGAKL